MSGKGDRYRRVDQEKWDAGWERAFGKEKSNGYGSIRSKGDGSDSDSERHAAELADETDEGEMVTSG